MAFATLTLSRIVQTFASRSNTETIFSLGFTSNKYALGAVVVCLMMFSLTLVPFMRGIFNIPDIFSLTNLFPVSDEVGLASEDSYSFTLENTGELKMDYAVYLKNRCEVGKSVVSNGETITPDICVPNDYVKLALKTGDGEYEIVSLNEDGTLVKGILEPNDELSFE